MQKATLIVAFFIPIKYRIHQSIRWIGQLHLLSLQATFTFEPNNQFLSRAWPRFRGLSFLKFQT